MATLRFTPRCAVFRYTASRLRMQNLFRLFRNVLQDAATLILRSLSQGFYQTPTFWGDSSRKWWKTLGVWMPWGSAAKPLVLGGLGCPCPWS